MNTTYTVKHIQMTLFVKMVWAVGLWAILLLTRRKFRFSTPAYLCSSGLYLCRERKSAK